MILRRELKCWCYNCLSQVYDEVDGEKLPYPITSYTFIVCPKCGNKRCPRATDHNLECTESNESGQEGSRY